MMRKSGTIEGMRACALAATLALLGLAAPSMAQNTGQIRGEVRNQDGKPFPGVIVIIKHVDSSTTYQTKTDKNGEYIQVGLRGGRYTMTFKDKDITLWEADVSLATAGEQRVDVNLKELVEKAKHDPRVVEAQKKREEEQKKFQNLKVHFDGGRAALDQAKQVRSEMQRAPADQRASLEQKLKDLYQSAVTEFQDAEKAAGPNEPNLHVVLANLGEAYDAAGRYDDAIAVYQKAIALRPNEASYYNNMGNALARAGKIEEAGAAYQKSATLEPANAAASWRNFGIVLFNANKLKEAVAPLRKSLEIDPKSAQTWYLLGASLVGAMGFKQEGDKVIPILEPGTVEAYEKCIELDPSGPYGTQARQGLEQLQAMGLGIQTKMKSSKKK